MNNSYYIKEDEAEIRAVCKFIEDKGFEYRLINDFLICYESEKYLINIEYERYGESASVNISFKNPKYGNESYSIGWSAKVDDEVDFEQYCAMPYSKLLAINKEIQFIKDNPDKVFDEEYCHRMKEIYDSQPI